MDSSSRLRGKLLDVISVYPNPTKDILNVSLNNSFEEQKYTFTIRDISGKAIFDMEKVLCVGFHSIEFPTNTLTNGSYIVEVKNQFGYSFIHKIVKID